MSARSLRAYAAAASLVTAAGCSLFVSTAEPVQCSTDRDCEATPSLRGRTCQAGICAVERPLETADAGGGDPLMNCVSTETCTQLTSGRLSVCRTPGQPCVQLQTPQCHTVRGSAGSPDAVVLGVILPLTAQQVNGSRPRDAYAERLLTAMRLAIDDFEAALPGGLFMADGKRRPFGLVACDSYATPAGAVAAFEHLTNVVKTPAVIIGSDRDLASVAPLATTTKTAIACSDCIGTLPPGPLAWRVGPRLELEAPMVARRVADLESALHALPSPPTNVRLSVLREPARALDAIYSRFVASARLNGMPLSQNDAGSFLPVQTDDPLETAANWSASADAVVAFQPDIVVVLAQSDFPDHYLPLIESRWPAGARKPFYITTSLNNSDAQFASVPGIDEIRLRLSGSRPAHRADLQANVDDFVNRWRFYANGQTPGGNWTGFEAVYSLAYAALAARAQPIFDGPHISAGFERLRGGATVVDYRHSTIANAAALLGSGPASIDVRGLWSDLDWNPLTRDFDSDVGTYCLVRTPDNNLIVKSDAGLRLETKTGLFSGAFACE